MAIEAGSSTYYQAKRGIVQNGLVLHLDFSEKKSYDGGASLKNLAKPNKNGTLVNSPLSRRSRDGGRSIVFDKTDDYINLDSLSTYSTGFYSGGVSYCIWYKAPNPMTYNYSQGLFVYQPHGGYWYSTCAGMNTYQYKVRAICYNTNGQSYQTVTSATSINDNSWHYLVNTFDPDDSLMRIYIDGELDATDDTEIVAFVAYSNGTTYIGGRSGGNQPTEGEIAMAQLYTRALSANEISQNFNATRHRFGV